MKYNAGDENATISFNPSVCCRSLPMHRPNDERFSISGLSEKARYRSAALANSSQVGRCCGNERGLLHRKTIEHARETILGNLKILRGLIAKQRSTEMLSADISIQDLLGDASEPLSVMLFTLPSNQHGLRWQQSLPSVHTEIGDLQLELRRHIDAYADKLQAKAESCSK